MGGEVVVKPAPGKGGHHRSRGGRGGGATDERSPTRLAGLAGPFLRKGGGGSYRDSGAYPAARQGRGQPTAPPPPPHYEEATWTTPSFGGKTPYTSRPPSTSSNEHFANTASASTPKKHGSSPTPTTPFSSESTARRSRQKGGTQRSRCLALRSALQEARNILLPRWGEQQSLRQKQADSGGQNRTQEKAQSPHDFSAAKRTMGM